MTLDLSSALTFLVAAATTLAFVATAITMPRRRATARGTKAAASKQQAPRPAPAKSAKTVIKPDPLRSRAGHDEISIVTWNLLANAYASATQYPHADPDVLTWTHRWQLIQRELCSFRSDFICLQELEPCRWPDVLALPGLTGYAGLLQERPAKRNLITCAILYRAGRFHLEWSEHRSRALIAAFSFTDAQGRQQMVYVVNVHLEGSPYRPHDRVSQLRSALQRLQQRQEAAGADPSACNVLIAGDFNCGPEDAACAYLGEGRLAAGYTEAAMPDIPVTKAAIEHPYALQEAYRAGGHTLPFTRKVPALACTLDFIWCSRHMGLSALYLPYTKQQEKLISRQNLPNEECPSDHLPIGAVVRLAAAAATAGTSSNEEVQESDTHTTASVAADQAGLFTADLSFGQNPTSALGSETNAQLANDRDAGADADDEGDGDEGLVYYEDCGCPCCG